MANIFGIEIGVGLNANGLKEGLATARKELNNFGRGALASVGASIGGLFAVGAITAASKHVVDYGGKLSDLAKQTRVGTTELQEFEYWAKQNGATLDDVALSLKGLGKARDAALGGDAEQLAAFAAVGLDKAQIQSMSIEQMFRHVADKIRTTNFGEDEGIIVEKLLGKGGTGLISALKESLAEASAEAHELGIILESGVVASLDRAGDALDRIIAQTRGPLAEGVAFVANLVQPIIDRLSRILSIYKLLPQLKDKATRGRAMAQIGGLILGAKGEATTPGPGSPDFIGPLPGGKLSRANTVASAAELAEASRILALKERLLELDRKGMTDAEKRASLLKEIHAREAAIAALKAQQLFGGVKESDILDQQVQLKEAQQALQGLGGGQFHQNVNELQKIGAAISVPGGGSALERNSQQTVGLLNQVRALNAQAAASLRRIEGKQETFN